MATQNKFNAKQREHKFFLESWYTDADIVVEPAEKAKVVVAGMVEAKPEKKEYPDAYFKRAFAVFKGEFGTMFKTTFWFIIASLLFIVGLVLGRHSSIG